MSFTSKKKKNANKTTILFSLRRSTAILRIVTTRPVARGAKPSLKFFSPPLEKCVGHSFENIGHSLKNLGPTQKTLRPTCCPKLVKGLVTT